MADKNSVSVSYVEDLETSLSAMERHISDFVPSTPVHQTSMVTSPLISGKEETDNQGHNKSPVGNGKAGGLSLLAAYQQSSVVDPEQRRRNKKKRHLSKWAWCFLVLAFLQG